MDTAAGTTERGKTIMCEFVDDMMIARPVH